MFEFEIQDHGVEHEQYFQGAGTAFTKYTEIATGCGSSVRDAGNDALEIFYQQINTTDLSTADAEALEAAVNALSEEEDTGENEGMHHYVSIRWRMNLSKIPLRCRLGWHRWPPSKIWQARYISRWFVAQRCVRCPAERTVME